MQTYRVWNGQYTKVCTAYTGSEPSFNDPSMVLSLVIKGQPNEDAVLCTSDKTYTLRSVVLSNSVLVVTPPPAGSTTNSSNEDIVIRDQLHEVLELMPCLPKLQKLNGLLRGREYDEGQEETEGLEDGMEDDRPVSRQRQVMMNHHKDWSHAKVKRPKFTYEDAREILQASDNELSRGLKEKRVLTLNGEPTQPGNYSRHIWFYNRYYS